MKVVCINIPPTFVTIKLEVNVQYDAFKREYNIINGLTSNGWFVRDELRNIITCDVDGNKKYFITLEQWRDKRLKELEDEEEN
jgi:hypothetical protein